MQLANEGPKEERPPYVRFERRAVEDRTKTHDTGHYTTKDVDFVLVTPIGTKDVIVAEVADFFATKEQQAREERIPGAWVLQWKGAYKAWQSGQETPPNGTPIRGWPVLSPAQQANVIGAMVLTVEDLAQVNDEAARRIGMGALDLREKAITWLKASNGPGKLVAEMEAMSLKLKALEEASKQQEEKILNLQSENARLLRAGTPA